MPTSEPRFPARFGPGGFDTRPRMDFLAFGVRHHPKRSHALTVYDIADERVAEVTARDLHNERTGSDPT